MIIVIFLIAMILLFCGVSVFADTANGKKIPFGEFLFGLVCTISGIGAVSWSIAKIILFFS